jgi:PPOX class probable F420-dependent enzyme
VGEQNQSMLRLLARLAVRVPARILALALSPAARSPAPAAGAGLDGFAERRYCLLLTRRRDGRLVPTPLLFALAGDRLLLRTAADSAKVRRARRDPAVLVAPCDVRGRPLGPAIPGRARELSDPAARAAAERAITARYGTFGRLWAALVRTARLEAAYLEVTRGRVNDGQ